MRRKTKNSDNRDHDMDGISRTARQITRGTSRAYYGMTSNPEARAEQHSKNGLTDFHVLAYGDARSVCEAEEALIRRNAHLYKLENRTCQSLGRIRRDLINYLYVASTPKADERRRRKRW